MAAPHLAQQPLWHAEAGCRRTDAEHFYAPPHSEPKRERELREFRARQLCQGCPVRQACLDYSLTVREPHGIWGGANEKERRQLIRQRAAAQRGLARSA